MLSQQLPRFLTAAKPRTLHFQTGVTFQRIITLVIPLTWPARRLLTPAAHLQASDRAVFRGGIKPLSARTCCNYQPLDHFFFFSLNALSSHRLFNEQVSQFDVPNLFSLLVSSRLWLRITQHGNVSFEETFPLDFPWIASTDKFWQNKMLLFRKQIAALADFTRMAPFEEETRSGRGESPLPFFDATYLWRQVLERTIQSYGMTGRKEKGLKSGGEEGKRKKRNAKKKENNRNIFFSVLVLKL